MKSLAVPVFMVYLYMSSCNLCTVDLQGLVLFVSSSPSGSYMLPPMVLYEL